MVRKENAIKARSRVMISSKQKNTFLVLVLARRENDSAVGAIKIYIFTRSRLRTSKGSTVSKSTPCAEDNKRTGLTLNVQTSQTRDQNYGVQQSNNRTNHNQRNYREQARPGAVYTYHYCLDLPIGSSPGSEALWL